MNTDTLYHLNYSPPCGDSSKKNPSRKPHSGWCGPNLSLFPCWNLQLVPFFPRPCLRSSLEVLERAEQGPWSCPGELSCSCPDAWLGAAPWLPCCSPAILALGICLGSAGSTAWQESALAEVPPYPTAGSLGGVFFPTSAQRDWCCLYFLKLELLEGFVVLVGLLPSFFLEH